MVLELDLPDRSGIEVLVDLVSLARRPNVALSFPYPTFSRILLPTLLPKQANPPRSSMMMVLAVPQFYFWGSSA